ncbi:response regulator [Rubripirellula reticaptiva]|uniref:Response regulator protein VraR n=1 Tax=Rubripirellula reticaptiva TaxID=2528013 RepID=A0A5C6EDC3_9BACT|nr:response regulator transcription factor [Rubripirellula reticaptiva]TWU46928.1 Response regulator protein VraR [Rubripirellula reticaptiva]
MSKTINVMLVEDHPEYRDVIDLALKDEADIELINQVGSSERALRILQDRSQTTMPDLILLDLNLPGKSGLESLPTFRSISPSLKIIVLTQSNKEADVVRAIQLGASGYLLKSSTVDQILDAIRTVGNGGAVLGSGIAKYILNTLQTILPRDKLEDALSQRELEILALLGEGLVKKEIAYKLKISISTVATYIRRIYEKLDVQNAPAAITQAYRAGILPHEPNADSDY